MNLSDRYLLGLVGLLALYYFFSREIDKRRCWYCGEVNGHKPDCPPGMVEEVMKG